MTDDQTQQYDIPPAAPEPAAPVDAGMPAAGSTSNAFAADAATADAPAAPASPGAPATTGGASKARWFVALGVAAIAIAVAVGALLFFSKTSAPEALSYIPGDAAMVMEIRMDLPGDQLQAAGNLLAHFPGFQDQSTLSQKIDTALKQFVERADSSLNYDTDVKPLIGGPLFIGIRSFEDMVQNVDPTNFVVVATTNGAISCAQAFKDQTPTVEAYNGVNLSTVGKTVCAADGRFLLVGDVGGVKGAVDAHKAATGLDKSTRYQEARAQLGLDRLATLYLDGTSLAKALPTSNPNPAVSDLAGAFPQWFMAGLRAENDALVLDMIAAPPSNPAALPSLSTYPPVHPIALTAFAPSNTLVFTEAQGFGVSLHNLFGQLASDPQFSEALKQLDQFGGLDGLVGWVDEAGFLVFRDGDTPAGAIILGATDATTASAKVAAIETVLALGAVGGDIDVSTATVEGVKVTTIHIPDIGAISGVPTGTPVPLDVSIAAKEKYVIVGVGTDVMASVLGVKPGAGLADDAAFKRALARGLPNPQVVIYVAAGATIDWVETAAAAAGAANIPEEVKAYLDPLEGFIYTVVGNGANGSFRLALTVATP